MYKRVSGWTTSSSFVGDPEEGVIALPVKALKDRYTNGQIEVKARNEAVLYRNDSTSSVFMLYTYKDVDAVVWLKYFNPIGSSPSIYNTINFREYPGLRVTLKIASQQGDEVEATFEAMQNRTDGMKVVQEDKQKLKEFWGSHGDKREYQIKIINEVRA